MWTANMRLAISCFALFLLGTNGNPIQQVEYLRGLYGSFSSPNYPDVYDNNLRKEWTIQVRQGYRIKFKFTAFDLEDSYEQGQGPCVYDYVLVTEDNKTTGRFCGNSDQFPWDAPRTNEWFYTKGDQTHIVFVSDYSNEDISPVGFSAHYVETDIDECTDMRRKSEYIIEDWDELVVCNHFCNNVPGSYYCSCRSGYKLHTNQHTCVAIADCVDQVLIADQGIIESPDYPNPYAKLSHCSWDIRVRDGLSVHLTFNSEFAVEEHFEEGCVYDIFEISISDRKETYCGTTAPDNGNVMDMNTKHVKIDFKTDLAVEQTGFRIIYNTSRIRCLSPLSGPANGEIATPNPKGYYEFEDVVIHTCNRGYDLIGASRLECLSDGSWNNEQPTCRIKSCGRPDHLISVKYSHIIDLDQKRFEYMENVTVECNDWYGMKLGSHTWLCEDSKKWVKASTPIAPNLPNDIPKCRPKCGLKGAEDNSLLGVHLFGGQKSLEHEWPWMVFLNFGQKKLSATTGACGGSLISPNYVLTAAHCMNNTDYPGDIRFANRTHVWLGVHNRLADPTTVKYVETELIIVHPKYYKASKWDYDVALIRLGETIIMGKSIRPVCLPSTEEEFKLVMPGKTGEVAGWGLYNTTFRPSDNLMHGEFPIVSHTDCWGSFQSRSLQTNTELSEDLSLTKNMFCAGDERGSQSTCQGDSGGPFVMAKKGSSIYYELGLVSFGIGNRCGEIISYTGFAKLHKEIVDWIMEKTNNLE